MASRQSRARHNSVATVSGTALASGPIRVLAFGPRCEMGPVNAISCMRTRNVPGGRGGGLGNALLFVKSVEKNVHHSCVSSHFHRNFANAM